MKTSAKGWVCAVGVMILSCSVAFLSGCSGLVSGASATPSTLDVTNVQAGAITTSGSQILWTTNVPATSSVDYGTTSAFGSSTPVDSAMVTSHQMALSGLAAGTTYYFQVNSTDSKGNHGHSGKTFKTAGFSLSGAINPTAAGNGATVALSGPASASATADSSGNYNFAGLANGTYTIAPSHGGFTFTPGSQSMAVNGSNVTGVNFTGTSQTFSISGTISPVAGGSGATVTLGGAASATTTANSSGAYTLSGLTAGAYTITPTNAGYTFTPLSQNVTVSTANVSSVNFTDNAVAVAPTITTQPVNQTVAAGQTASFTAAASGTAPLNYQWQKSGVNIAGATSASYTTPATTTSDSGSTFRVVVTNAAGTATSSAATLTVNAAAVAPTITTQPANQTVIAGQTAAFTVVAGGTAPLSYQWQKSGVNIAGANSTSYTTPATTTADSGSTFAVVVTNTAGTVTSSAATLTVNAAAVAPTITTQPANQTVTAGQTASFTAAASGTAPLNYQWQKSGVNITGATSASYTTPATTTSDSGSTFRVVVTNTAGTMTSSAATLTVNAAAVAPTITTQPTNQTVTAGQAATFTVVAGGTAPLSYQWQKSGVNIAGANSTSYTTPATTTADSGSTFRVVVTNAAGTVTSSAATLTVNADTTAPTVPTGLTATAVSSSQINLSWTASTDNVGVTGYNVYRGGTKIGTAPGTTFQDAGLTASTSYTYNVSAFDAAGNTSAQSAGASATTQAASSGGGIPSTLGWYQIPNTTGPACPSGFTGCNNVVAAWSGGVADPTRNRLIVWGGGHTDYNGNEVYSLDLNALTFTRINNPSAPAGSCVAANPDGTPNSRHTYDGLAYLPSTDQMFAFNGSLACGAGSGPNPSDSWTLNFSNNTWQAISYTGNAPGTFGGTHYDYLTFGDGADYDSNTGLVFAKDGGGIFTYNPSTKVWTPINSFGSDYHLTSVVDPTRKLFISAGNSQGFKVNIANGSGYPATNLNFTNCGAMFTSPSPGLAYDPIQNLIVGWGGGDTAYLYNPDTDSCTSVTYPNGPGAAQQNGTFGRFRYFPSLGVFAVVNSWSSNAYTLRLTPASGGGGTGPNISAISVNSITTVTATVSWTTDVPATTQVEYGTTTAYGNLTTLNSTLTTSHSQALTGLAVGTLYHYRVHSKNSSGVESISGDAVFSTNSTTDTTPPTVSMTAPASGATVSGTVTVSANATDNVAVASVQFTIDGTNLGSAIATAPYQISWDTTKATNGVHAISAVAVDTSNNSATAGAVSVTVSNSGNTALQDFQSRCATAGVIVCEGFDDAAEFVPAAGPQCCESGLYSNAGPTTVSIVQDTTIVSSGTGSLKFPIAANDGGNPNTVRQDNWVQLFCGAHPPASCTRQVFGPSSTFYVQFRYRVDSNYVNTDWELSQNGGSSPKIADFASFNSSCGQTELTTNNRGATGSPMMYTNCGSGNYGGVYALPGTTNPAQTSPPYAWQSSGAGSPGYECDYPSTPAGLGCFTMPANTWMTFYYKVQIGASGTCTVYSPCYSSAVTAWIGPDNQPLQKFIDVTNFPLGLDTPGYDAIFFNVYMTGFLSTATNPAANVWLDEVIVSSSPIPAPAVNGGGIPQ